MIFLSFSSAMPFATHLKSSEKLPSVLLDLNFCKHGVVRYFKTYILNNNVSYGAGHKINYFLFVSISASTGWKIAEKFEVV